MRFGQWSVRVNGTTAKVPATVSGGVPDEDASLDDFVDLEPSEDDESNDAPESTGAPDESTPEPAGESRKTEETTDANGTDVTEIDEAADSDADGSAETDDRGAESAESDDGEPLIPDDVAPATSTSKHSPDGVACDGCGTTVDRVWRDGDGLVCPDCKDWS